MAIQPPSRPPSAVVGTVGTVQETTPIAGGQVQHLSVDWSVLVPLIFAGIALLINTSVSAWKSIRVTKDVRATKTAVERNAVAGAAAGAAREAKLDHISGLVNGRYSQVLQELADVRRQLAAASGREADRIQAAIAQDRADAQAALVRAAGDGQVVV